MFNWFKRSSKSAPAPRTVTRGRPPPSGRASEGSADAGLDSEIGPQALARLSKEARQLSPDAQRILARLPAGVDMTKSCAQFPQAVEKLLEHWRNPREFRLALDSLLMVSRGGRQGFPFDVVREFSALREYYDVHVAPLRTGAWASVDAR